MSSTYKIQKHCNFEEEIPKSDKQELDLVLNQLAQLGWNSVQWGTFSIKMKKDSFGEVFSSKNSDELFDNLGKNTERLSADCFVEVFGETYSSYLRGDAPSILESAKKCLTKAEKINACLHPSLEETKESFSCPDCKMKRYKTIEEVLEVIKKAGLCKWEFQIMDYVKSLIITDKKNEVILSSTHIPIVKPLLSQETSCLFVVQEEKDVTEDIDFFGTKETISYKVKKGYCSVLE